MKKYLSICLITIIMLILVSCSTIEFTRLDPEYITIPLNFDPEIDLSKYDKISVGQIDGFLSKEIVTTLEKQIWSTDNFTVLDRSNLNNILAEHGLTVDGYVDPTLSVETGRLKGAAAMIVGNVIHPKIFGESDNAFIMDPFARIEVLLKVLDVETGEILTIKHLIGENDTLSYIPTPEQITELYMSRAYSSSIEKLSNEFIASITETNMKKSIGFKRNSQIPEMDQGISSLKGGKIKAAMSQFQQAIKNHPDSWQAYFNYASGFIALKNFDKAIEYYEAAYKINPSREIAGLIKWCEDMKFQVS